ncbi:MAG: response regulator [Halobacteriovoraceae bacterium]|nr:response regulator [Halobacteriovoraceae bacterium]
MDKQIVSDYITVDESKIPADIDFLIVEDEPDVAELLKESLVEEGFTGTFTKVTSMEEARSIIRERKNPFDFIISDWNLREMSGLDLLLEVKQVPDYKNTPFLMVTANDNISGMLVAIKKGASEYLVKPWEHQELLEKISSSWEKSIPPPPVS